MIGGTAVITRPGCGRSAGPRSPARQRLSPSSGYPVRTMTRGTLDGGDVLKVGGTVYVGRTLRTSAAGIAEFRRARGAARRSRSSPCR